MISETIDVETAFLYGLLKETVYLRIPEGFNEFGSFGFAGEQDCLLLLMALYGLVQACSETNKS